MSISKVRLPNNTEEDIKAKYLIQSSSSDATSAEFSARTVTEDAIANIQKIYGNTVKWNQLVQTNWFASTSSSDVTFTNNGDGSYTINGTASAAFRIYGYSSRVSWGDHKYYLSVSDTNIGLYYDGNPSNIGVTTESKQVVTAVSSATYRPTLYIASGKSFSNKKIYIIIVDLTAIYGSGNEPSVSEFEAQYPAEYYPYSPLTLLSNSATAIQSKDSGDNVIGNCDLNIQTLTGKLNGAGSSVVIFPNGMKKAGSFYDELFSDKAIKRIARIDLSVPSYSTESSTTGTLFIAYIAGMKAPSTDASRADGIICSHYPVTDSSHVSYSKLPDKSCMRLGGSIVIKDSDYTDPAVFKNAMSGVKLYYEITTYEEYTLDNALQLQYPVVAGGTEMVLPTTGTAPMKMDVIYGNAADATSNLSSNFISVDSMKAFLNNLGTQMGGTWNMQYNNGKFEFTFSSS